MSPLSVVITWILLVVITLVQAKIDICPVFEDRASWGAASPTKTWSMGGKPSIVLVKETGLTGGYKCGENSKYMQDRDMKKLKRSDIECSFVIGWEGNICEGRGWFNSVVGPKTLVMCVSGEFHNRPYHSKQLTTLALFFTCSHTKTLLDPNYKLITLRDMWPMSLNPGEYLYDVVKRSTHYLKANATNVYKSLWKQEESVWTLG